MQEHPAQPERLHAASRNPLLLRLRWWTKLGAHDRWMVIVLLPTFALIWWLADFALELTALVPLIIYLATNLTVVALLRHPLWYTAPQRLRALLSIAALSDFLVAMWLLVMLGPLNAAILPAYAVMTIKTFALFRFSLGMMLVPSLIGPIYLGTMILYGSTMPSPLESITFWTILVGSIGFIALTVMVFEWRLRLGRRTSQRIDHERQTYQIRSEELESINTDLRNRIRAQQSLEESLRAITGSLSLDEVLRQILDSMMQMLGTARVSAAALTLAHSDTFSHRTLTLEHELDPAWPEPLAQHVLRTANALIIGDTLQEREWQLLANYGVISALSVPLIDVGGNLAGALTVVSRRRQSFTSTEARHMTSFSIQASVAIHNAELHSQLVRQQAMLEAVLRDIGDGLVVLDDHNQLLLHNPHATTAFEHSDSLAGDLRAQLSGLANEVRGDDRALLSRELCIGPANDEQARFYRAFASLVRVPKQEIGTGHVAIVLHDITLQKADERTRVEFIAMVSHELRNPLNTLNGFLKIVIQGRAGTLTDMQQEFLDLAGSQADLLKGRITELLEFQRIEAGHLRIQPAVVSLTDLILTAGERLKLQAEQSSLTLTTMVPNEPIDMYMDGERINQVITNLVENAIKATPAGGTVQIEALLNEHEAKIAVADTGIGIPSEEQGKIFNRFYRVHNRSSHHGAHLGLGLTICQQIVESHQGRIWVESEEGKGSRFVFTIPRTTNDHTVGGGWAT